MPNYFDHLIPPLLYSLHMNALVVGRLVNLVPDSGLVYPCHSHYEVDGWPGVRDIVGARIAASSRGDVIGWIV